MSVKFIDGQWVRRPDWNGYGLSSWRCKCGAARKRPYKFLIRGGERLERVWGDPCKRCGTSDQPECIGDPWLDIDGEGLS